MIVLRGTELRVSGVADCNPPELFRAPPHEGWLIAHCRPRQEKQLAANMDWLGIPRGIFYERRLRRYQGKGIQESMVPLLGGYVFFVGGWPERDQLFRTGRVVRVITPRSTDRLGEELQMLAMLVDRSEAPLQVKPEIVPGCLVTITKGSLAGLMGVVVKRTGTTQLVVNLSVLGTSVGVELPAETAESLDA